LGSFCRAVLISLLVVSLADLPATAANPVLGFVLEAQSSQIDGVAAIAGTNVFAGDILSTGTDGGIRLQVGPNQIYMPASSAVTLTNSNDGLTATLSTGAVAFSARAGAGIAVSAEDVIIRPKTPEATSAEITVLASDELKIASVSGPLALELDGESYTLTPGRTYGAKIVVDSDNQGAQKRPARRRRRLLFFLFFATAGVATVLELTRHKPPPPPVSSFQP
jgi:hypothetical protein